MSKKAILIFGPPRSGTSSASTILEKLGVYFGESKDFVDPRKIKINPIFFELKKINQINNKILKTQKLDYNQFTFIPNFNNFNKTKSKNIINEMENFIKKYFNKKKIIGIKDPRMSYTFPYWKKVLKKLNFTVIPILCIRDVNENILSNLNTNKFDKYNNTLLSHSHVISSINNLCEESFYIYNYNKVIGGDFKIFKALCKKINIKYNDKVNYVIKKKLKSYNLNTNKDYFANYLRFNNNDIKIFVNFLNSFKEYYESKINMEISKYKLLSRNYKILEKNTKQIEHNYFKVYEDFKKLNENKNFLTNSYLKIKKFLKL